MKRNVTTAERKRKAAKRRQCKSAKYRIAYRGAPANDPMGFIRLGKYNKPVGGGVNLLEHIKQGCTPPVSYRLMSISFEPFLPNCFVSTVMLGVSISRPFRVINGELAFTRYAECFETALFTGDDTIINRKLTYATAKDLHMLAATAHLMNAHKKGEELPPALAAILDKYSKPARYASEYKRLYRQIKPFFNAAIS